MSSFGHKFLIIEQFNAVLSKVSISFIKRLSILGYNCYVLTHNFMTKHIVRGRIQLLIQCLLKLQTASVCTVQPILQAPYLSLFINKYLPLHLQLTIW